MLSGPKLGIVLENKMSVNLSYQKMSTVKVVYLNFLLKIKIQIHILVIKDCLSKSNFGTF
jgi:hypothetical protein